jgi:TetR/AcrR family transcriptional regulator, repressor for neighboring sulfatase
VSGSAREARSHPGPHPRHGGPEGPDEVRRAVLDAAADLFARRRVDNVTLRDIAAQAHVQVSLIGRYVGTRAELIDAVLDDLTQQVAVEVVDRPTELPSFERDSALGRWAPLLAYRALAGDDLSPVAECNPVQVVAAVLERDYGLEASAARVRAAQVVASALGWRLFERYLVAAGGLEDRPVQELRDQLAALHVEMARRPAPTRPASSPWTRP